MLFHPGLNKNLGADFLLLFIWYFWEMNMMSKDISSHLSIMALVKIKNYWPSLLDCLLRVISPPLHLPKSLSLHSSPLHTLLQ